MNGIKRENESECGGLCPKTGPAKLRKEKQSEITSSRAAWQYNQNKKKIKIFGFYAGG